MADHFAIRKDLRATLLAVSGLPAVVAYENVEANPGAAVFVEERIIPIDERPVATGTIEQRGIFQITLVYPIKSGTKDAEDVIDAILAAFPPASSHGTSCRVDRSQRNPALPDGKDYRLPVSVYWRAYSTYALTPPPDVVVFKVLLKADGTVFTAADGRVLVRNA